MEFISVFSSEEQEQMLDHARRLGCEVVSEHVDDGADGPSRVYRHRPHSPKCVLRFLYGDDIVVVEDFARIN